MVSCSQKSTLAALNACVKTLTVLLMSTNVICPKCGGTDSYESLQKRMRVPMCKQCSEVMYSPDAQLKLEKKGKNISILLFVIFGVVLVVVITPVFASFVPGP